MGEQGGVKKSQGGVGHPQRDMCKPLDTNTGYIQLAVKDQMNAEDPNELLFVLGLATNLSPH